MILLIKSAINKIEIGFLVACGILIPLPIYIDIFNFSLFLNHVADFNNFDFRIKYLTVKQEYPHIPIGLISIFFLFFYFIIKKKLILKNITYILIVSSVVFFVYDLQFLKLINFIIFFALTISVLNFGNLVSINCLRIFFKCYFYSFLTIIIFNLFSILIFDLLNLISSSKSVLALESHHIFGFELYQYYVVFIGYLNLLLGVLFFSYFLSISNNSLVISKSEIVILSVTILIVLFFAARKISIIYISIILLIYLFSYFKKQKLNKTFIIQFLLLFVLFYFFINHISNIRQLNNFNDIFGDRLLPIYIFYNELEFISNYKELFFGYKSGISGYSNLFIGLFASGGLVGVILIFVLFYLLYRNSFLKMKHVLKKIGYFSNNIKYLLTINIFFYVVLFIDNIINLNLLVPYYYINFLILYLYKIYLLRVSAE